MEQISVVIITLNEERNIERCLKSLEEVADEIIVLDSFSTDKTSEICQKFPVKFIQKEWMNYSASKNFANSNASYDYILSIDADEALSDELKRAILELKTSDNLFDAYCFNRLANYCGKWIRHGGWYPDTKLRLWNRHKGQWEGEIHEAVKMERNTKTGFIKGDLLHYSYYSIEQHLNLMNKYTDIMANELFNIGKNASIFKLLFSPVFKFIRDYILKLGFLDGYTGFVICRISTRASFLKYTKLRRLNRSKSLHNKETK
ncbi:MAG: glycosyltransferase family 2 protein [Bacteroidales bacterium]|jgi:glycosyltransferase involved in cell wall biosynthesis